jgi:hypothetical protein
MLLKPEETVLGKRPAGLDNRTAAPSVWDITAYSLHMTPLLTTAVVTIAALLLGRRARKRTRQLTFEDTASIGLPPLDPRESNAVMHDAEKAAIRVALGDKTPAPNPHPRGTRANIIWDTHFHSVLMDWDGDAV